MHATAKKLLEAHTQHVMQQLSGSALTTLLETETAIAFDWLCARPVTALVDETRVRDFLIRNVFALTPSESLLAQIGTLATNAITSPLNKTTKIEDLLNAREYDAIVDNVIALEEVRRNMIRAVMQNPAVTQLISDLVYNGVKNYLMEYGGLSKKVPGMSSLMKMGKGMMERMGSLDAALENTLKNYINRNTKSTMEMSERLVEKALETPKLKNISRQFWQEIKMQPLDKITRHVREENVTDVIEIGQTIWNHFRQTTYAREQLGSLVHTWFEHWGSLPANTVLESIGLPKERLQHEVMQLLTPLLPELEKNGHLEARVRAHLEVFYSSDAATAAFKK